MVYINCGHEKTAIHKPPQGVNYRHLGGEQFASDCVIRHTVCSASIQSGVVGKYPRGAALVCLMRTGERESCTRFGEFLGFVSRRRNAGSLHGSSKIRSSIAFLEMGPVAALVDYDRHRLRRPFDPVEQAGLMGLDD